MAAGWAKITVRSSRSFALARGLDAEMTTINDKAAIESREKSVTRKFNTLRQIPVSFFDFLGATVAYCLSIATSLASSEVIVPLFWPFSVSSLLASS